MTNNLSTIAGRFQILMQCGIKETFMNFDVPNELSDQMNWTYNVILITDTFNGRLKSIVYKSLNSILIVRKLVMSIF